MKWIVTWNNIKLDTHLTAYTNANLSEYKKLDIIADSINCNRENTDRTPQEMELTDVFIQLVKIRIAKISKWTTSYFRNFACTRKLAKIKTNTTEEEYM